MMHPMRSVEEEEMDRFGQLASHFPGMYKYNTGAQFMPALQYMLDELELRQSGSHSSKTALWWLIARPELLSTDGSAGSMIIDLKELLQKGPKYNIHVVIWNRDVKRAQNLQLTKALFKERICMEMTAEESKLINGDEIKPMPSGYKAVLIGENLQRFRIYDLPDGRWMNALFERLK